MRHSPVLRLLPLLALLWLAGCSAPSLPPIEQVRPAPTAAATRHVIVISIDGLRPDAIDWAGATNLQRLLREGAYSLTAQTVIPSQTLPSHTSMLTGVGVETHGITWNSDLTRTRGIIGVPTALEVARQSGLHTAAFMAKRKLRHLLRPGSLDWLIYPRMQAVLLSDKIAGDVVQYLKFERPNLVFVHLPDPDLAGHSAGWMTRPYRWAVRRADAAVGHIQMAAHQAFGDDVILIVTADHGGSGRSHSGPIQVNTTIPWIAWGYGVRPGEIPDSIRTYDTAATALQLLGVPVPPEWEGKPVNIGAAAPPLSAQ